MKRQTLKFALYSLIVLAIPVASTAHASTGGFSTPSAYGVVWEGAGVGNLPAPGSAVYGSSPSATFDLAENSNLAAPFNFNSIFSGDNLSSFLTKGGDSLGWIDASTYASAPLDNTLFSFWGATDVKSRYTFEYNGGMLLYLNDNLVLDLPSSGTLTSTTLCVGVTGAGCDYSTASIPPGPGGNGGSVSFHLVYAAANGSPEVLESNMNMDYIGQVSAIPEPGTMLLLGTGLVVLAFAMRRRLFTGSPHAHSQL